MPLREFLLQNLLSESFLVRLRDSSLFFIHLHSFDAIIIIHSLEPFTSALADGFSLESEWQQVSSSLQDSF